MESDGEDDKLTLADLAEAGMMAELKLLLESDTPVDVNEKSPDDDFTALHWSCLKGNLPMTELLLQKGADMNVVDEKGATPLHAAAKCGRVVVIELLLKREARMHKVDNKGNTPLHVAAKYGQTAVVQLFIDSGVNIKMKDRKGRTACERAMEGEHNDVVELLLKAGSDKIREMQNESQQLEKDISDITADLNKLSSHTK